MTAAAIQNIVGRQLSLPASSITVTGPSCYCVSGTPAAAAVQTCGIPCLDLTTPVKYVTISAQYTYNPILPTYSKLVSPVLTEAAMARLN